MLIGVVPAIPGWVRGLRRGSGLVADIGDVTQARATSNAERTVVDVVSAAATAVDHPFSSLLERVGSRLAALTPCTIDG
jgi:hypothetical protein